MSYYNPNYYSNYPYNMNNQFSQMPQQQYQMQMPQYQNPSQTQMTQPIQMGLNGKIVDSEDVVKVTEVPIGGYGVFPKADLSEVYIKSWNSNGTTSIITFKPVVQEEVKEDCGNNNNKIILEKIQILENKIDNFINMEMVKKENAMEKIAPIPQKNNAKKEVNLNAY